MTKSTRILLLDDHPLLLDGLAAHLSALGHEVLGRCLTQAAAREVLGRDRPDVAILDVKVDGALTFDFAAAALAEDPTLRVIFITGYDDDAFIERAFASGAHGFVLKSESPDGFARAVERVRAGQRYVSPSLVARFPALASSDEPVVTTRLSLLTPREREVLQLVSAGRSAKEISRILSISVWTVTNHKANIMAKLGIHNQVGLTRFAVSTGVTHL